MTIAPLDRTTSERLAKLIPMLGSNHDGEVVAASKAIARVLSSSGRDWHDLSAALTSAPPKPTKPKSKAKKPTSRKATKTKAAKEFAENLKRNCPPPPDWWHGADDVVGITAWIEYALIHYDHIMYPSTPRFFRSLATHASTRGRLTDSQLEALARTRKALEAQKQA